MPFIPFLLLTNVDQNRGAIRKPRSDVVETIDGVAFLRFTLGDFIPFQIRSFENVIDHLDLFKTRQFNLPGKRFAIRADMVQNPLGTLAFDSIEFDQDNNAIRLE